MSYFSRFFKSNGIRKSFIKPIEINKHLFCASTKEIITTPTIYCRDIFYKNIPKTFENIPEDILNILMEQQNKSGFIPNIFLILLRRPDEFRAFFDYYNCLMKQSNSELTINEKEMIIVATSSYNKCLYCIIAHGAMLRVFTKKLDPTKNYTQISDQVCIYILIFKWFY